MKEKEKGQQFGQIRKPGEILKAEDSSKLISGESNKPADINKTDSIKKSNVYDSCPHCGRELSPWEKVLLSVDRMLMCKNCWYRIFLDVLNEDKK